jgi:hypothetical protein
MKFKEILKKLDFSVNEMEKFNKVYKEFKETKDSKIFVDFCEKNLKDKLDENLYKDVLVSLVEAYNEDGEAMLNPEISAMSKAEFSSLITKIGESFNQTLLIQNDGESFKVSNGKSELVIDFSENGLSRLEGWLAGLNEKKDKKDDDDDDDKEYSQKDVDDEADEKKRKIDNKIKMKKQKDKKDDDDEDDEEDDKDDKDKDKNKKRKSEEGMKFTKKTVEGYNLFKSDLDENKIKSNEEILALDEEVRAGYEFAMEEAKEERRKMAESITLMDLMDEIKKLSEKIEKLEEAKDPDHKEMIDDFKKMLDAGETREGALAKIAKKYDIQDGDVENILAKGGEAKDTKVDDKKKGDPDVNKGKMESYERGYIKALNDLEEDKVDLENLEEGDFADGYKAALEENIEYKNNSESIFEKVEVKDEVKEELENLIESVNKEEKSVTDLVEFVNTIIKENHSEEETDMIMEYAAEKVGEIVSYEENSEKEIALENLTKDLDDVNKLKISELMENVDFEDEESFSELVREEIEKLNIDKNEPSKEELLKTEKINKQKKASKLFI